MLALKARSCLTNFICLFEEITKCVDEGSPKGLVVDREISNWKSVLSGVPQGYILFYSICTRAYLIFNVLAGAFTRGRESA